jgi:hypothetical protein
MKHLSQSSRVPAEIRTKYLLDASLKSSTITLPAFRKYTLRPSSWSKCFKMGDFLYTGLYFKRTIGIKSGGLVFTVRVHGTLKRGEVMKDVNGP